MLLRKDVDDAKALIAHCESDLGYKLSPGSKGDLLADNHNEWSLEYIIEILVQIDREGI